MILARHKAALMRGCLLCVGRMPWIAWSLRARPVWGELYEPRR
jgi:hypothetical protein